MTEQNDYFLIDYDLLWMVVIVLCVLFICITLLYLNCHPYQLNFGFTMDNNTLEAVKSINWSAVNHG